MGFLLYLSEHESSVATECSEQSFSVVLQAHTAESSHCKYCVLKMGILLARYL